MISNGVCIDCRSQGIIWALPLKGEEGRVYGPFVFKCSCAWGKQDWRRYPLWNSFYRKHFKVDQKRGDPDPKPLVDPTAGFTTTPYQPKVNLPAGFDDGDDLF